MASLYRTLSLLAVLSGVAAAQTQTEFEVASIKPASPDARGMFIRPGPGGGINITNMSLKEMIVIAWHVQPFEISGGPPWFDSLRYDIVAKPETKAPQNDLTVMLQALLKERFQLAIHMETKELPIYALVLARKDGKLGPKLIESKEGSCVKYDPSSPPPPPKPGGGPTLGCGGMMMGPNRLMAAGMPLANLAPGLSRMLGRKVVDQTGLTGNFDISLEWTPDEFQAIQLQPDAPRPPAGDAGPSIFVALQEQLGLKLESQKGSVQTIVVDRAEKPSGN